MKLENIVFRGAVSNSHLNAIYIKWFYCDFGEPQMKASAIIDIPNSGEITKSDVNR